ncbi:MAG: acylphosphatase [Gammaproteobacteria bacterium]
MACFLCRVSGRVQGVWYRASTAHKARELGLTGHAHNLSDGSVEVLACGEDGAVQDLLSWLWQGPPAARVEQVSHEVWRGDVPIEFTTA